ncbi:MAG: hypothetical protein Q8L89_06780 [Gammaproteobacteria bacterium]|nr:hypothetical protein [Gammaproteobacteria bacterium]
MTQFLSHLPHILWPAAPSPAGAQLLALLFQLQDSQWWPANKLEAGQFRQLHGLLAHAWETIPFYRDRLTAAGFHPDHPLKRKQWQRLPILTRSEVQAAGEALFCPRPPDTHLPLHRISTSGSTGKPITVQGTAVTQQFRSAFGLRDHLWQQRDFGAKLAAIRGIHDPAKQGGHQRHPSWALPVAFVFASGPASLLEITAPIATQADWLLREAPAYLLTYPTNALALAEHFLGHGLSLPSLRQVQTIGESLPDNLR